MTNYLFHGKTIIRNDIGTTSKAPARPRPPLISLKELASLLGISNQLLVSKLANGPNADTNPPPEPAIRSNSQSRGSITYYHKAPALAWAKKAGLL